MYNENGNDLFRTYPTEDPQEAPAAEPVEETNEPIAPPIEEMDEPTQYGQTWTYTPPEYVPYTPAKKEKKPLSAGKLIAIALSCSLIGGILGAAGSFFALKNTTPEPNHSVVVEGDRENTVLDISKIDTSKIMTPAEVYATNVNSTVGITTSITTNYWGYQTTSAASGSGFVLTADGYILTNHHVIEGSNSITVSFYDGSTAEAALIGYDVNNDIAVLKVDAENLQTVVLGDSDNLNVGDTVVAIGNPLGELTFSLTAGAVSALDREVTTSNGITMNLMQTDCAINSGNSGGALFNLYGEVIGITNAKYSSSSIGEASIDNIGFAIPVNDIRNIVQSIIEKGYIAKPYIGVSVTDVSEETQSYGLPQGAAVKTITEDSPAAQAGLQINDIITQVDGVAITGSSDLVKVVTESEIGDTLKLTVYRQGSSIELEITIGEQIQSATQQAQTQQQQQSSNT